MEKPGPAPTPFSQSVVVVRFFLEGFQVCSFGGRGIVGRLEAVIRQLAIWVVHVRFPQAPRHRLTPNISPPGDLGDLVNHSHSARRASQEQQFRYRDKTEDETSMMWDTQQVIETATIGPQRRRGWLACKLLFLYLLFFSCYVVAHPPNMKVANKITNENSL